MSNLLAEGTWPCTVLSASAGEELDQSGKPTGVIKARVAVKIDEGPSAGRNCTYEDEINTKSSLYVLRSLKACGWTGPDLGTVGKDVDAWIKKTGGKSTVEVKHLQIKNGKRAGQIWDKVNAIGRGPKPLAAPSKSALNDANAAMREAMELEGGYDASAPTGGDDDSIPFLTASASAQLGEIAKVLK